MIYWRFLWFLNTRMTFPFQFNIKGDKIIPRIYGFCTTNSHRVLKIRKTSLFPNCMDTNDTKCRLVFYYNLIEIVRKGAIGNTSVIHSYTVMVWHRTSWRHQLETFPRYWTFVRGIHRSPMNSPHKGQWRVALMFFLSVLELTME